MKRRKFIQTGLSFSALGYFSSGMANDFGASKGFPGGWPPLNERGGQPLPWVNPDYLVNNMSGGMEPLFKHAVVKASTAPSPLKSQKTRFKLNFNTGFEDYQKQLGKPAMLVARGDTIHYENYEFERNANMRFYSKSMAKSVLGLLTGLALENGVIQSLDDPIEKYDARLKGKPLGAVKIQQALNMSSGVDICQINCGQRNDYERWEESAFAGLGAMHRVLGRMRTLNTDADKTAIEWPWGFKNPSGTQFNYSSVDPHLVSMAIRGGAKMSIAEFTEKTLWQPLGAQADAMWFTDSKLSEDVSASFCATLRDWGRIGLLVAQKGAANGKQILSESWFSQYRNFKEDETYLKPGNIANKPNKEGYKNFVHIPYDNPRWLRFGGDLGQTIFIDQKSGTVLVILSVNNNAQAYIDLFKASIATLG
jgi:CubicO group peptidase (beta-lactamase class C family)